MFRQMDEAFNRMMKNFGAFDNHVPDQEQGINIAVLSQSLSEWTCHQFTICLFVSRLTKTLTHTTA